MSGCYYSQILLRYLTVYSPGAGEDVGRTMAEEGVPRDDGRSEEDPVHRG